MVHDGLGSEWSDTEKGAIFELVDGWRKSLRFSKDQIKATSELPGLQGTDKRAAILALAKILRDTFSVSLPPQAGSRLLDNAPVRFVVAADQKQGKPPRKVTISLDPEKSVLAVQGTAAMDGKNGYSKLFFDWEKKAGRLSETGAIDLKKLNRYPAAEEGKLLASIFAPIPGRAGISSLGKKIEARGGERLNVEWDLKSIEKIEDPADPGSFELRAKNLGIVNFTLFRKGRPESLQSIGLSDTLSINGDVDYAVGDVGKLTEDEVECPANLQISGRVRGNFSLQSNGFIHVADSIEGRLVKAREIKSGFIANGCQAEALEGVEVGSIAQAQVSGKRIAVETTATNATLTASEQISFAANATCLAVQMNTRQVLLQGVTFAGRTEIILGEALFSELEERWAARDAVRRQQNEFLPASKQLKEAILNDLARFTEIMKKAGGSTSPKVKKTTLQVKATLMNFLKPADTTPVDNVVRLCNRLQKMLGEEKVHESVIRKVDSMSRKLGKYDTLKGSLSTLLAQESEAAAAVEALDAEIRAEIRVDCSGISMRGGAAELLIRCGEAEEIVTADTKPSAGFVLQYGLPDQVESAAGYRKGSFQYCS